MVVRIGHARRLGELHRRTDAALHREVVKGLELRFDRLAVRVRYLAPDVHRLQRLALVVEHREVIPLIALAGLPADTRHRVPVRLPVEDARAAMVRHIDHMLHEVAQARGLPLYRAAVAADALRRLAIGVRHVIKVLVRVAKGRLDHDDVLVVAFRHVVHVLLQLLHRAVPERIVGHADDVKVVDAILLNERVEEVAVNRIIAAIRQVNHRLDLMFRIVVVDGFETCGDHTRELLIAII